MHSNMVVPPETHFFYFSRVIQNRYEKAHDKQAFSKKLIDFWYNHKTRIKDLGLPKKVVVDIASKLKLTNPYDLFTLLLTLYRKERGAGIVGEKTPRHILYVREILKTYPDAKIISLFRDPRAAAWSEIKAPFGSPSVIVTTRRWRKYVKEHEQLKKLLPENQYLMLRYSDLIANTEGELQKICTFLGMNFEEAMLEYYNREEEGFAAREKSWKNGTLKPLQENRNEEWKSALTAWQITLVEHIAGDYLTRMGYEKSGCGLPFQKKLFYQCVDFSRSIWATLAKTRDEGYKNPSEI